MVFTKEYIDHCNQWKLLYKTIEYRTLRHYRKREVGGDHDNLGTKQIKMFCARSYLKCFRWIVESFGYRKRKVGGDHDNLSKVQEVWVPVLVISLCSLKRRFTGYPHNAVSFEEQIMFTSNFFAPNRGYCLYKRLKKGKKKILRYNRNQDGFKMVDEGWIIVILIWWILMYTLGWRKNNNADLFFTKPDLIKSQRWPISNFSLQHHQIMLQTGSKK